MATTLAQLDNWLNDPENELLEVKEARNRFDFEELVWYRAALANEGGGTRLLGVGDRRPRRVVGSQAIAELERTKAGLVERLRLRIEATVLAHIDGRVLTFDVLTFRSACRAEGKHIAMFAGADTARHPI